MALITVRIVKQLGSTCILRNTLRFLTHFASSYVNYVLEGFFQEILSYWNQHWKQGYLTQVIKTQWGI